MPGSDSGGNVWADLKSFPYTPKPNKRHDYTLTWLMLFSFSRHIEQLAHRTLTTNSVCKVARQRRLALR